MQCNRTIGRAALVLAVVCGACSAAPGEDPLDTIGTGEQLVQKGDTTRIFTNRLSMNGVSFNGQTENGDSLNGLQLNGSHENGLTLNGQSIDAIGVDGAELVGALEDTGALMSGDDFIGVKLTGKLSNGEALRLRIDDVEATADPEIWHYTVRYWDGDSWEALCGDQDGVPITALALEGRWDYSSGSATGGDWVDDPDLFTFACNGAVIAKCVKLGYEPWGAVTECNGATCKDVPMRALHQACTRMMRADYCGDGTPHTLDGTPVNLWDGFGVQTREVTSAPWRLDAEWSPDGAVCIENLRYDWGGETSAYVDARCPDRDSASFSCFGGQSTFFTMNGYTAPLLERSLIRNEFKQKVPSH